MKISFNAAKWWKHVLDEVTTDIDVEIRFLHESENLSGLSH